MKKSAYILAIAAMLLLASCAQKTDDNVAIETPAPTIPADIAEQVTGEEQSIETVSIADEELSTAIKKVNSDAVLSESLNPGMKMLQIELPISEGDDLPTKFISQLEKIVAEAKLAENKNYDYIFFSTGVGEKVYVSASFNRTDEGLTLDKLNAVESKYKDGVDAAAKKSELFKIAQ